MPAALDTKKFIEKAKAIHGDKYNYDKTVYKNNVTKVIITCPEHGDFEQLPRVHIYDKKPGGCKLCGNVSDNRKGSWVTTEMFVEKAKKKHGGDYSYHETVYVNNDTKVKVWCNIHNEFFMITPESLLLGHGCTKCGKSKAVEKIKNTCAADFEEKAIKVHGSKYDYSKVVYDGIYTNVEIVCPVHGSFFQTPSNHLLAAGCPSCRAVVSSEHQEIINFLGVCEVNDKTQLVTKELDIWIPNKRLAIEVCEAFMHNVDRRPMNHLIEKLNLAESKDIHLITIYDIEWHTKRKLIENRLNSYLGKNRTISGRDCTVEEVDAKTAKDFCDTHHLSGGVMSTINICLKHNDEIVVVGTFSTPRFNKTHDLELIRFCSKTGIGVVGGLSKVINYLKSISNFTKLLSYADRRFTSSKKNAYLSAGFTLTDISDPGFFYSKNDRILNRFQVQKQNITKIFPNIDTNNIHEELKKLNWTKTPDCGNLVYTLERATC